MLAGREKTVDEDLNWYAVHVRSRHEFVACGELGRKGIEAYLPSMMKVRQWKDRKKQVRFTLFPGYLFTRIATHQEGYLAILKTKGVVAFVCLEKGNPTPIPPEEIISLKSMIDSGRELDIHPHLREGARVRVKKGPLRDAEGILIKKENRDFFVVNIDILGRSVGVELSADDVEAG